jgi:hypothetical protein
LDEVYDMAQEAVEVSHKPEVRKKWQEKYKKAEERRLARLAFEAEERANKAAAKAAFIAKLESGEMVLNYVKIEDARVAVAGSSRNGTVWDVSSAKCKDYCSKSWWCDVTNYNRKKSECTLLQKKIGRGDVELNEEIEFDLYLRTTDEAEQIAAKSIQDDIIGGRKAEKIMQVALDTGAWECAQDPDTNYGSIKASKGSCETDVSLSAGTGKTLTPLCDISFKGASAQIYGGALLSFAAMLRDCPQVKPPPKPVVKVVVKAAQDEEKLETEAESVIAMKQVMKQADDLSEQMNQASQKTEAEAAQIEAPESAKIIETVQQSLAKGRKAMATVSEVYKSVVVAKEKEKKLMEANAALAAKEAQAKDDAKWNWRCPVDPLQRAALHATFNDCDAAVAFSSSTKAPLQGDCKRLFRIASSQTYGDALLRFSKVVVTCKELNSLSAE